MASSSVYTGINPTTLAAQNSDVKITQPLNNDQALVWNSSLMKWVNKSVSGGAGDLPLGTLPEVNTDVEYDGILSDGQTLIFNGGKWRNIGVLTATLKYVGDDATTATVVAEQFGTNSATTGKPIYIAYKNIKGFAHLLFQEALEKGTTKYYIDIYDGEQVAGNPVSTFTHNQNATGATGVQGGVIFTLNGGPNGGLTTPLVVDNIYTLRLRVASALILNELEDVNHSAVDNHILKYNATTSLWESELHQLSTNEDVDSSLAPAEGHVLTYTAGQWTSAAPSGGPDTFFKGDIMNYVYKSASAPTTSEAGKIYFNGTNSLVWNSIDGDGKEMKNFFSGTFGGNFNRNIVTVRVKSNPNNYIKLQAIDITTPTIDVNGAIFSIPIFIAESNGFPFADGTVVEFELSEWTNFVNACGDVDTNLLNNRSVPVWNSTTEKYELGQKAPTSGDFAGINDVVTQLVGLSDYQANNVVPAEYLALDTSPVPPSVRFKPSSLNTSVNDWLPTNWSTSLNSGSNIVYTNPYTGRKCVQLRRNPTTNGYPLLEYQAGVGANFFNNTNGFTCFYVLSDVRSDVITSQLYKCFGLAGSVTTVGTNDKHFFRLNRSDGVSGSALYIPTGNHAVQGAGETQPLTATFYNGKNSQEEERLIFPNSVPCVYGFRYQGNATGVFEEVWSDVPIPATPSFKGWTSTTWVMNGQADSFISLGQNEMRIYEFISYNSPLSTANFVTVFNSLVNYHSLAKGISGGKASLVYSPSLNKWTEINVSQQNSDDVLYADRMQFVGAKVFKDSSCVFGSYGAGGFQSKGFRFNCTNIASGATREFQFPVGVQNADTFTFNLTTATLQNKSIQDNNCQFIDNGAPTKVMRFELATINTPGSTTTLSIGNMAITGTTARNGFIVTSQVNGSASDVMINLPSTFVAGDILKVGATTFGTTIITSVPNPYMYGYLQDNTTSSTSGQNNIGFVAGSYTVDASQLISYNSTGNVFTYTGTVTQRFRVSYSITPLAGSNTRTVHVVALKNATANTGTYTAPSTYTVTGGTLINGSRTIGVVSAGINDTQTQSGLFTVSLATNDTVRFFTVNVENNDTITIPDFSFSFNPIY